MTRMRSILLAGTSLVLVLTACGSGSPGVAGHPSGGGSGPSAGAGNVPGTGSGNGPAIAGNPSGSGTGAGSSAAGNSVRDQVVGPGVVAVRSGTAATSVNETDYLKFVPASVNVRVGDIVGFTNAGAIPHNVTFPYAGVGSPTMQRGNSYLVKFESPGTYQYVCTLHFSGMLGTITVVR